MIYCKNFLDTMCEKGIINKHDKNSFVVKNKFITKELNNVIAKKDISKFFSEYEYLRIQHMISHHKVIKKSTVKY